MTNRRRIRSIVVALVACALAGTALSMGGRPASAGSNPTINVLSTRADLVSGGDALVSVTLPVGTNSASVLMTLNGNDVTAQFAVRPNAAYEGLVTGLALGGNQLVATIPGGSAQITITNHAIGGPVFSGPQVQPWACEAGATNAQCDKPTVFALFYRSHDVSACNAGPALPISAPANATGCFLPYDPSNPPSSVSTTTTNNGHTVPYIIRIETGYQDRDQYKAAVLFTPNAPWQPWAPQPQWDTTLEVPGGSSCGEGHTTGTPPGVTDDTALSRGIMVADPALDNNGHNCNIVVQAEAVEMMKEHIVDDYGPIRFTIGSGCSGGSIYQQQIANAYPGLLNGLLPNCSFPDSWSTGMDPTECALLLSYFGTQAAAADGWTPAQEAGVVDDQTTSVCQSWVNVYSYSKETSPSNNGSPNNCGVGTNANDPNSVYNVSTNPGGVRCDLSGYMPNVLGIRQPSAWGPVETQLGHGFVNRPFDNVGVQYGLSALLAGTVTAQQFADMNAQAGGFDIDGNPQGARSVADPAGLVNVYRSGAVDEANNLSDVAILDLRGHDDAEIHSDYRSYAMRARLDNAQGGHQNHAIWTGPAPLVGYEGANGSLTSNGFVQMDQWLTAVYNDTSNATMAQKIATDKPASAVDTCFDAAGNALPLPAGGCTTIYPYYGSPRVGAGEPLADDILKCQLKPFNPNGYPGVTFTTAEVTELQAAFPTGVCDWSKPGVSQAGAVPWQTYQDSSGNVIYGGRPLGAAPASQPPGLGAAVPEAAWVPALLLGGIAAGGLLLRRRRGTGAA